MVYQIGLKNGIKLRIHALIWDNENQVSVLSVKPGDYWIVTHYVHFIIALCIPIGIILLKWGDTFKSDLQISAKLQ